MADLVDSAADAALVAEADGLHAAAHADVRPTAETIGELDPVRVTSLVLGQAFDEAHDRMTRPVIDSLTHTPGLRQLRVDGEGDEAVRPAEARSWQADAEGAGIAERHRGARLLGPLPHF